MEPESSIIVLTTPLGAHRGGAHVGWDTSCCVDLTSHRVSTLSASGKGWNMAIFHLTRGWTNCTTNTRVWHCIKVSETKPVLKVLIKLCRHINTPLQLDWWNNPILIAYVLKLNITLTLTNHSQTSYLKGAFPMLLQTYYAKQVQHLIRHPDGSEVKMCCDLLIQLTVQYSLR